MKTSFKFSILGVIIGCSFQTEDGKPIATTTAFLRSASVSTQDIGLTGISLIRKTTDPLGYLV